MIWTQCQTMISTMRRKGSNAKDSCIIRVNNYLKLLQNFISLHENYIISITYRMDPSDFDSLFLMIIHHFLHENQHLFDCNEFLLDEVLWYTSRDRSRKHRSYERSKQWSRDDLTSQIPPLNSIWYYRRSKTIGNVSWFCKYYVRKLTTFDHTEINCIRSKYFWRTLWCS